MLERRLSHLGVSLHGHLVSPDLFYPLLGSQPLSRKLQLSLGLHLGQFKLVLLVGLSLEEVQQLWQTRDQQATKGRK